MVPHFVVERKLQFVRKLVVAVQIDLFRGESRFEGRVQFPCGHGVHADVFRIRNFIDGKAGKRLGSVQHESVAVVFLLDRIAIDRTHIADILFVHHIQRRPETLCQSNGIRPADLKVSLFVHSQCFSRIHKLDYLTRLLYQKAQKNARLCTDPA